MRVHCKYKSYSKDCEDQVKVWTTVTFNCNAGYVKSNDSKWIEANKCLDSGDWLHPMPTCKYGKFIHFYNYNLSLKPKSLMFLMFTKSVQVLTKLCL